MVSSTARIRPVMCISKSLFILGKTDLNIHGAVSLFYFLIT